jgi:hypothetical protein
MASLIEQMEHLQKQQAILAEKIKEEEERNKKLANEASIERLEALIKPITQHLDWICPQQNGRRGSMSGGNRTDWSVRHNMDNNFEIHRRERDGNSRRPPYHKYENNHMLASEEIFVTLLGIIKKQDARIEELENGNKVDNKRMKRASTIEFSDLQMMKRY